MRRGGRGFVVWVRECEGNVDEPRGCGILRADVDRGAGTLSQWLCGRLGFEAAS